jgi:hypothetical protein
MIGVYKSSAKIDSIGPLFADDLHEPVGIIKYLNARGR